MPRCDVFPPSFAFSLIASDASPGLYECKKSPFNGHNPLAHPPALESLVFLLCFLPLTAFDGLRRAKHFPTRAWLLKFRGSPQLKDVYLVPEQNTTL